MNPTASREILPSLMSTLLALNEIARGLLPETPDVSERSVFGDVHRYLSCGGDASTASAIAKGDAKAFLYLVHEAVELRTIRSHLDAPAPSPRMKPIVAPRPKDPWIKAISRSRNRGSDGSMSPIHRADAVARGVEVRLEWLFARLFLGIELSLVGLVDSISTGVASATVHQRVIDFADQDARARTREVLGLAELATPQEQHASAAARSRVWGITVRNIDAFDSVEHLAFAIWEARGRGDGYDWRDWFAAERAMRICKESQTRQKYGT